MVGKAISHYEITEKLGEGGMGVVYKARDNHLKRFVALKVLPPEKVADPERKRRFVQEARSASALNHPNIVTVYDIDQADGVDFIAMEYVEGKTLDELIGRKGLKLNEALKYALQIADALAKAHGAGIVHRDLKPGNVMVTTDGRTKVLDFGLAKLTEPTSASPEESSQTEQPSTETGLIVGTVSYMSPEQAEGKKVDARSDIFSFGSLLYEMLTGRRPFRRDTPALTLAAILHLEPPPLPAEIPQERRRVILRCLRKDPSRRIQHMDDVKLALEELEEESDSGKLASAAPVLRKRRRWFWAAGFAALVVLVAMVAWWLAPGREETAGAPLRKFAYAPEEGVGGVAISPDGKQIVYVSGNRLWVQDLEQTRPRELEGTQGAGAPFWSPESDAIGFAQHGALKRVFLRGGEVIAICQLPGDPRDACGSWSADGSTIVFQSGLPSRFYAVSSAGGTPEPFINSGDRMDLAPHWLPPRAGLQMLLYTRVRGATYEITLHDRETGEQRAIRPGFRAVYSPTGHILFHDLGLGRLPGSLLAVSFSLEKMETTGEPFQVAQNVSLASVSLDGTLVYREGGGERWQLVWRDRSGTELGAIGQPQNNIFEPRLSRDGTKIAVTGDEDQRDIWIHDAARPVKTRLTSDRYSDFNAAWSADGRYITYASAREAGWKALRAPADGSGATEIIWSFDRGSIGYMCSWSPGEGHLLYSMAGANGAQDIWYLQRTAEDGFEPVVFRQTAADERPGDFSPDGRYVVYFSDESGRFEVYVRSFPSGSGLSQVSANGGVQPRWSQDGKEIFYVEGNTLVAVSVATKPGFAVVGAPKKLFQSAGFRGAGPIVPQYDFTADGKRFVTVEQMKTPKPVIRVVQNWFAEFRDRQ